MHWTPACAGATNRGRLPSPNWRHGLLRAMPKATLCVRGDLGAGKEKLLPMSVNRSVTKAFEPPPPRPPARVPCQSPPAEGAPRTKRQESKALDPGLRRGDESCPNAVPETKALHAAGNGEAEPAVAFPFCSAERSLRPAGIVASMSEPARASFDATRRARVERGHRREPALRQGALLW